MLQKYYTIKQSWLFLVVAIFNVLLQIYLTEDPVLGYVLVNVLQVTPWLEISSIRVKVIMGHSLLNSHTEAHTLVGESVDGIHKFSIIRRQSVRGRHTFKQRTGWIEP